MKKILLLLLLLIAIYGCSATKRAVEIKRAYSDLQDNDSTKYDLIVLDPGFESWYLLHNSPAKYRSQGYYENWNLQYVSAWNSMARTARGTQFFQTIIGYEYGIDYGFELNHKLFYYFQYVEHVLKIPILRNGPSVI